MIIGKTRTNQPVEGDAKNMAKALEGQDVDLGDVTGDSIIENMSGYSCLPTEDTETTEFEPIYAGVVKNGNKLTFVYAVNVTKISNAQTELCNFTIPSSIGAKLYPVTINDTPFLAIKSIDGIETNTAIVQARGFVEKISNTNITLSLNTSTLTANEKTYVRFEITFLLSDNLISE